MDSKHIGMSSCVKQQKREFVLIPLPKQQPIGVDMTLPNASPIPRKDTRTVFGRQNAFFTKNTHDSLEFRHVVTTAFAELIGLLELPREADGVLHFSSCSIKSSKLFAS